MAASPIWPVLVLAQAIAPRRPELAPYFGARPVVDERLAPGEWADATPIQGVRDWAAEFTPVVRDDDLALRGWVTHDDHGLYFAFEITADVLYGLDTPRWLPKENARARADRGGVPLVRRRD